MRKRTAIVVAAGFLAAVVAGGVVLFWPHSPYPCRATFEQVKVGMTRAEVDATVGAAPGNYARGTANRLSTRGPEFWYYDKWLASDGELLILFDEAGVSRDVVAGDPAVPVSPTFLLDRILDQFGF